MENNNTTNQTEPAPNQNQATRPDWRDSYNYRSHHFVPRLLLTVILVIFAFMLGAMVSSHRNYRGTFVATKQFAAPGIRQDFGGGMMAGGHRLGTRTLGSITVINGNNLTVHNASADQTVVISDTTAIYKAGAIAKQSDLKTGDVVSVFGQPGSNGQINATRIIIQ